MQPVVRVCMVLFLFVSSVVKETACISDVFSLLCGDNGMSGMSTTLDQYGCTQANDLISIPLLLWLLSMISDVCCDCYTLHSLHTPPHTHTHLHTHTLHTHTHTHTLHTHSPPLGKPFSSLPILATTTGALSSSALSRFNTHSTEQTSPQRSSATKTTSEAKLSTGRENVIVIH